MATPNVLAFDAEGRAIDFDVWVDDLLLFLQCDRADGLSLFDLTSGASPAPAATEDATVRSQWATRDAAARLAVRRHLPPAERAHFGSYKSAKTLYDAVIARYSTPATAALSRLMLPYLFPDLAAFATVADLITHLRTSDACFRAALPAEFCAKNPPPQYFTLYYIVTRLPDSLRGVRDDLLAVCPTTLTVEILEKSLLAPEKSILAIEGCSPSPLSPSVASAATADLVGAVVEAAGAVEAEVEAAAEVRVVAGVVAGVEVSAEAVEAGAAAAVVVGVEAEAAVAAATVGVAVAVEVVAAAAEEAAEVVARRGGVAPVVVSASSSSVVRRPSPRSSSVSGTLRVSGVGVLVRALTSCALATVRFPDASEIPRWDQLSRARVAIFDLDFDAILAAMYAVTISEEGDCYRCFPPDPGIGTAPLGAVEAAAPGAGEAVALGARESESSGAGESALSGTVSTSPSLTFTLDSGASRSFFRDRTTLTPLSRPVAVSLADPSGGPVLARYSTVLPCPAVPSGALSGLYLPSFSTNLVAGADLQDAGVDQFTPARRRVTHCTDADTGRHLTTFTRGPGSSLYTLTVPSPPPASGQVAASGWVTPPCLVSGAWSLTFSSLAFPGPSPPGPGPPCVPCVEGRLRATPHSSPFPPTEAPMQTLHMDVWGPACVHGQGHERYFLLVVDDYSRYTTVFPLRSKGEVTEVLIDWIRAARLQLRRSFCSDFLVLRLHSDRGGEFSSGLLRAYCRARGIRQTFTLPDSPQQNGIAERRIGIVMDVARTSMVHAAAPHFLWPFAVRYTAHQLNLQPRVSRPETSPALLWTGKVGDASAFRVWGSRAFVRDLSADKLSPRAAPCVFLGFPTDAPGWQFYHPSSRRVLSSQDVTFDESVPFYRLFPYRTPSLPPPPDFLTQLTRSRLLVTLVLLRVLSLEVLTLGVLCAEVPSLEVLLLGVRELGGAGPGSATAEGAEPGGAEPGGTVPGAAELGGAGSGGAGSGAAEPGGTESRAAEPGGATSGAAEPSSTVEGAGAAGPGAAGPAGTSRAGAPEGVVAETTAVCPGGGSAAGAAGGPATGGVGGGGAVAEGAGAVSAESGAAARPRPYFVPLLQHVLGLSPPVECSQPVQSQSLLEPSSPLPAPSPYTGPTGGLAERREPASRPASPVRATRTSGRGSRQRPPPVPGTQRMSLRPSTAPLRAPLPSPPESSLPALADPASDSLRAASPTVTRLLATVVTDPSFESTAASALVAELVDFAARCRLGCAASLVAESASVCPPSVGGECALGTDVLEDRQEELQCLAAASPHLASVLLAPEGDPDALDIPTPRSYAEAVEGPYSSQWQAAMDAEMASWKSTGTYVDAVPPPGANIVSGMWIFRVKRPPGSPPVFKARYVARGFSQRQGVDYFQTFSPTPKMTTLRVLLHIAAQRDYELHSLDFSTAFLQGRLHEDIWLRRPPGFTGTFPPGTQWSLRRPVYGLRQAPREWHDTLRTTLAALGFAPSTADPSLFLRTDTSLPPFYILVYVDDLVFATADTAGLAYVKSELLKRHTCTDLGELRSYLGLQITPDRARRTITLTQSHMVHQVLQRFGFTYSLPQATPLSTRHSLSALPSDESVESSGPYPELVGCLMYLMTCTRPDLAYPLSILARYVAPGIHRPEHMAAAKRVLRYLCSTSGMGLVLGGQSPVVLTGHADASWADDQATQRSSQGYTFSLGSGSVSWRATRSSSVLSSSCEAEIYAGAMAAQEPRWLTYLLTDLGEPPRSPPVLYVDNKAMLALCREQRLEHRTKHIALCYFLARELQQRGQLRLAYVASEANTADVFTKALVLVTISASAPSWFL
ncbi:unnamed protein product [Closterium sp. NIES-64]|nr:unnamed protein product [Closterium sp. NIES-64]